ncbi:MAG: hypothetical protein OXF75_01225 [Acidimicrobiaceae bacterium]|nr:hypothetical protein [Acidimicrobiaceae bacterium]
MTEVPEPAEARPAWFVGASWGEGHTDDQTNRFVREGVWVNGYEDRFLDLVKSVEVGDRIAIKSAYTRKNDLPFDNRGHHVAVMAIKAVGSVTENLGDGRRLKVDWQPIEPQREWYFFTNRRTVWKVSQNTFEFRSLIDFTFSGRVQEIDKFRNLPPWRDKFGDDAELEGRFSWTSFYSAFADRLLAFRDDRPALLEAIYGLPEERVRSRVGFQSGYAHRVSRSLPPARARQGRGVG